MKRIVATVAFGVLLCASGARAERFSQGSRPHAKHILVGLDTEFGIPLGDYSDVNSVGAGAMLVGEYPVMNMVGLTARLGFQAHVSRTIGANLGALGTWGAVLLWAISAGVGMLQTWIYAETASMFPDKPGGIWLYAHEGWRGRFSLVGPIGAFGYWIGWSVVLSIFGYQSSTCIDSVSRRFRDDTSSGDFEAALFGSVKAKKNTAELCAPCADEPRQPDVHHAMDDRPRALEHARGLREARRARVDVRRRERLRGHDRLGSHPEQPPRPDGVRAGAVRLA